MKKRIRIERLLATIIIFTICLFPVVSSADDSDSEEIDSVGMFAEINGISLWYAIEGEGTPIFLPEIGGALHFQRILDEDLRDDFSLIFIEPRGSGRSTSDGPVTMDNIIDDIEALRKMLGLEKIAILGWSANSYIALEYALKYPESVSNLIMVGSAPYFDERLFTEETIFFDKDADQLRKDTLQKNLDAFSALDLSGYTEAEIADMEYAAHGPWYFYDPQYDCSWMWEGNSLNMEGINNFFGVILYDYDPSPYFSEVKPPVLIIQGRYDYIMPYYLWEPEMNKFRDAKLAIFNKSGHYPFFEESEKFNELLEDWVK